MRNFYFTFALSFLSFIAFAQADWRIRIEPDNAISIQYYFFSQIEEVKIVVTTETANFVYSKDVIVINDQWYTFSFPSDFELSEGDSIMANQIYALTVKIKKKRETEQFLEFVYDPSPNTILQLNKYDFEINSKIVWGDILDAYSWDDKIGKNIVVRSVLDQINQTDTASIVNRYLYFYHFLLDQNNEYTLIRKFTDSYKNCENFSATQFIIPSIELTDINKDTIGEISVSYILGCQLNDSVPYTKKVLLTSNGEKHIVEAYIDPCIAEKLEIVGSLNLKEIGYFDRFLRKKLLHNL